MKLKDDEMIGNRPQKARSAAESLSVRIMWTLQHRLAFVITSRSDL